MRVPIVLAALTLAPPSSARQVRPTPRELLAEAVIQRVRANPHYRSDARYVADSLRIVRRPSQAIPGLVYYWGLFTPPGTADVGPFTALAATAGVQVRVLSRLTDWVALGNALHWVPSSDRQALAACSELVQVLGPGADPHLVAIFTDSLRQSRSWPIVSRMDSLSAIAKPPIVNSESGRWDVLLWAAEVGRAAHYRCTIGGGLGGVTAELTTLDTVPGLGFMVGP